MTNIGQVVANRSHHNLSLFDHLVLVFYSISHLFNQRPIINTHFHPAVIIWNPGHQLFGLISIQRGAYSFHHWSGRASPRTLVVGSLSREIRRIWRSDPVISLFWIFMIRVIFVYVILYVLICALEHYLPRFDISLPFTVKVLSLSNIRLF